MGTQPISRQRCIDKRTTSTWKSEGRLGKHSDADIDHKRETRQGGVDVRGSDGCRIYQFGLGLFFLATFAEHTPLGM